MKADELFLASAEEKDPVKIGVLERKIFMLRHGYIANADFFAGHGLYNTKLKDTFHPWAASTVGEAFGSREYSRLIPLSDYLSMPVDILDDILEGVARGEQVALRARQAAAELAARQAKNKDSGADAIRNATRNHR